VERFLEKRIASDNPWVKELRAARNSFEEKRFQEAEELYSKVAKNHFSNPAVLLECADFFLRTGNHQVALTLTEKVLTDSPDGVRALHIAGLAHRKLGKLKEAAERLLRANRLSPLNSQRNVELADVYLAQAEEQIAIALKGDNENSSLLLARARFQLLRREYAAVVNFLDAKKPYLSEAGKKEADFLVAASKKFGGIR
jgi:tetratricopeptide (TPR) repeat protein